MPYRVEFTAVARKQLRGLDGSVQRRVDAAILELADTPRPAGSTKLVGREAWRIRIGDYRVIYEIHDGKLLVMVVEVGHRREIYR